MEQGKYKNEWNRGTKAILVNTGNQNFDFVEQRNKVIYFRGTREQLDLGKPHWYVSLKWNMKRKSSFCLPIPQICFLVPILYSENSRACNSGHASTMYIRGDYCKPKMTIAMLLLLQKFPLQYYYYCRLLLQCTAITIGDNFLSTKIAFLLKNQICSHNFMAKKCFKWVISQSAHQD